MPLYQFVCPKCGKKSEELLKNCEMQIKCDVCGETLERDYTGSVYGSVGKRTGGCSGNCKTCSGCK